MSSNPIQADHSSNSVHSDSVSDLERLTRLENIVEQIGHTVIASSETVEKLALRVDALAVQLQNQNHQVKQQGLSVFALTDAVQNLVELQSQSNIELQEMTRALKNLVINLNHTVELPKNQNFSSKK